jgi:hypothetical protein
MEQERIESRLLKLFQSLFRGKKSQLLNDFYLVHFHWYGISVVKFNLWHFIFPPAIAFLLNLLYNIIEH